MAVPIRALNHESCFLHPPPPRSIINVRWPVGRSCGQNPLPRLEPSGGANGLTLTLEHGSLPETPEAVDGTGQGRVWDQLHQQAPQAPGAQGDECEESRPRDARGQTRRHGCPGWVLGAGRPRPTGLPAWGQPAGCSLGNCSRVGAGAARNLRAVAGSAHTRRQRWTGAGYTNAT